MLIESVTSVAFGPLKGETLVFAPQLTVVYGPNEAGKSSWHAAIYASLCGLARRGGQSKERKEFADLRRPWSGDAWEVRAIIHLDDRRRIELRQDLADLAHCSATDADLGRDVASEILNEGTPDAAKWLGLDRESFLSVACVRQAEVQSVTRSAAALQDELQRAAASAARDATAAEAIARIKQFQRDQVGQEQVNSTKPLQRAKVRVAEAQAPLTGARAKHAEWLTIEAQALDKRRKADEEERKLRLFRALRARKEAESWHAKLDRARALAERYPEGQPARLSDDDALAEDVASALGLWRSRPAVRVLTGKPSAAIRAEIAALPPMPSGDRTPQTEVVTAKNAYDRASQMLELHEAQRLPDVHATDAKGLTADQLRDLARDLETTVPPVDSGLEAAYREALDRLDRIQASRFTRPLIAGLAVAGVVGGAGVWVFWNQWIGATLVLSGVAAFVWMVFRLGGANGPRLREALLKLETQVSSQRRAVEDARGKVDAADVQITELGLPVSGAALRDLADELVLAAHLRQVQADWSDSQERLRSEVVGASKAFAEALRQAGIVETSDLTTAFQEYEQACGSRAEQATRAATRDPLNEQLSDREAAEKAADEARAQRVSAEQKIMAVLSRCGLEAPDAETASEHLSGWQAKRRDRLDKFGEATRECAELRESLAGGTLEDLEARASDHQRQAAELAAELGPLPEMPADVNLDQEVRQAELAQGAAHAAIKAETLAQERAREVPSVSEAEEVLACAQQELERVTRLSRTLALTIEFLRKAEDRVHRDIAPVLASGLRRWLADVTGGRYTDARVDPKSLSVTVLGPDNEWRDARHLSHGTAEQIYLLLRAVLAERLATTGETCPLILDDVLVQSDRVRKHALLDVIVSISRGRQVILLTREEEVLRWAQANVAAPDRVVVLPGP